MLQNKIGERRVWSESEDRALKELYENLKLNRWSLIAQQLEVKYGFGGRTGKQCRERCFLDYEGIIINWTLGCAMNSGVSSNRSVCTSCMTSWETSGR